MLPPALPKIDFPISIPDHPAHLRWAARAPIPVKATASADTRALPCSPTIGTPGKWLATTAIAADRTGRDGGVAGCAGDCEVGDVGQPAGGLRRRSEALSEAKTPVAADESGCTPDSVPHKEAAGTAWRDRSPLRFCWGYVSLATGEHYGAIREMCVSV